MDLMKGPFPEAHIGFIQLPQPPGPEQLSSSLLGNLPPPLPSVYLVARSYAGGLWAPGQPSRVPILHHWQSTAIAHDHVQI